MQQVQQQALNDTAIPIASKHPALSSDPRVLCAAAGTCRAWQEAVQQCSASNTAVKLSYSDPLRRLRSFSRWLPEHSALVSSIDIDAPSQYDAPHHVDGQTWDVHLKAAQQLLQLAIAAVHHGSTCLPSISSITLAADTSMLAALPAHSLTHLDLKLGLTAAVDGQAAAAAIARLSNLQQLHLHADWHRPDLKVPYSCIAGVEQLNRLTLLELAQERRDNGFSGSPRPLVQLLAQPLPLRVLRLNIYRKLPLLDMSRLTQLEVLSVSMFLKTGLNAIFPCQLQQLQLGVLKTSKQIEALMPLQQLRVLKFEDGSEEPGLLLRLTQLPALQQLSLRFGGPTSAAAAAAAWPQLPQLRELVLNVSNYAADGDLPIRQQCQAIFDGVAACTNLTKLHPWAPFGDRTGMAGEGGGEGRDHPRSLCAKLAGLTNLKHLQLFSGHNSSLLVPGDALALTALTGLTRLELSHMGDGVGDLAAAALAGSCAQLQHLRLFVCGLHSMACLATVRHLTQLTEVRLDGNGNMQLTQQGLMLLTALKRLKQLAVYNSTTAEVTDEVVESFWAAVRGQQQ